MPSSRGAGVRGGLLAAAILALAAACTGTETGNPSLRGQMGFAGKSSLPLVGLPGESAPVVVTDLYAHLDATDFNAAGECPAGMGVVELVDVGALDLLAPAENLRELDVEQGAYCAATVRLIAAPLEGVPAVLAGRSLAVRGSRRSDGATFEWTTAEPVTVVMPTMDSLYVVDAEHLDHVITFDVARFFGRVDLEAAVVAMDGVAHLDAPENAAIGATLLGSIGPAVAMNRDPDGDGIHETGEPPVVHGDH